MADKAVVQSQSLNLCFSKYLTQKYILTHFLQLTVMYENKISSKD